MGMGFGVMIALMIFLCIFWKCCCKAMNGQASGKVAPTDEDPEILGSARKDENEDL